MKLTLRHRLVRSKAAHLRSELLKRALLMSRYRLPSNAAFLTSDPICSPSRSKSVQMNSALAYWACLEIFSATGFLSCCSSERPLQFSLDYAYRVDEFTKRGVEQPNGRGRFPFLVCVWERNVSQVTEDAGHGDIAFAPWLPKVEGKVVILDKSVPSITLSTRLA